MKDVARLAGVSTSTVSHVVNGDCFVSEHTQQKVKKAIQQLNYTPSALARSLKTNKTATIGMLFSASNNPFYSEMIEKVENSCYERGYSFIFCMEDNLCKIECNLKSLLEKRVDGLLLMSTEQQVAIQQVLQRYLPIPTVLVDWGLLHTMHDIIQDDSLVGGELATGYLIEQGYQRIACIAGPLNKLPAQQRLHGYRLAMQRAKLAIPREYEVISDQTFAGGLHAMLQLLALPQPPEAVCVGNDAMAIGVYQAAYQHQLVIPKDLAVIGYDDIEIAQYLTPPLSTIRQPKARLAQLAVETLIARIHDPDKASQVFTLTPELVVRDSAIRCQQA